MSTKHQRYLTLIIWGIILSSCTNPSLKDSHTESAVIQKAFHDWQIEQIKNGSFWAKDSCNPKWFANHNVAESSSSIKLGFPEDSTEYCCSYSDINDDSKIDGLIVFEPLQCDGGNLLEWTQMNVFILSSQNSYFVTDTIDVSKFGSTFHDSTGFYHLDSIANQKIFGTYLNFRATDGRSSPSIQIPVVFDFLKRQMIMADERAK
jgi:hypothetical protein